MPGGSAGLEGQGALLNNTFSKIAVWLVIALVLFTVFKQFGGAGGASAGAVSYSDFLDQVKSGQIKSAVIDDRSIIATTVDDKKVRTNVTYLDRGLIGDLVKYGVKFDVRVEEEKPLLLSIFISWFPMLLLIGVWIFFMRQMQGGGRGGAFSFGKSKARMLDEITDQAAVQVGDIGAYLLVVDRGGKNAAIVDDHRLDLPRLDLIEEVGVAERR